MLTIIRCSNCNKEKGLPFIFQHTTYEGPCKKCWETKIKDKIWHFCSFGCALKFIRKIKTHKCEQYYKHSGASINKDKSITIYEQCSICFKDRWKKIKGIELRKYLKENPLMKSALEDYKN